MNSDHREYGHSRARCAVCGCLGQLCFCTGKGGAGAPYSCWWRRWSGSQRGWRANCAPRVGLTSKRKTWQLARRARRAALVSRALIIAKGAVLPSMEITRANIGYSQNAKPNARMPAVKQGAIMRRPWWWRSSLRAGRLRMAVEHSRLVPLTECTTAPNLPPRRPMTPTAARRLPKRASVS